MLSRLSCACLASGALFGAPVATANMGNIASTYGVLPQDLASAQALSLFNSQVSATYYNPAYLARDGRGELTVGLFHAEHELRVKSLGGPDPVIREGGDVLEDDPTQHVLIGMKTDLTSLTRYNRPFYLGFMAGVERYGREMLAFESKTSTEGQFFNYGRQPLFLNLGGGMNVWRGVDVGLTARITLHASATLDTWTNLEGETSNESLSVEAKPVLRPIAGINVHWGETFCPDRDCWMDNLETALAYRGYSNTRTKVDAFATIPGVVGALVCHCRYRRWILSSRRWWLSGRSIASDVPASACPVSCSAGRVWRMNSRVIRSRIRPICASATSSFPVLAPKYGSTTCCLSPPGWPTKSRPSTAIAHWM